MEESNINSYEFREELKKMVVSCIGLNPNTINKKTNNIFKKYGKLIFDTEEQVNYYIERYKKISTKFETLKSGIIKYEVDNSSGIILLKEIVQVEEHSHGVLIILKNGRKIELSEGFAYLKELF